MTPTASTDPAKLREELDLANRKLAEAHKLAFLGRLSSGIVHEINSPVASILANNEIILRSLEKLKHLLTDAKEHSATVPQKAFDLVESIAALSEVDKIACERISGIVRSLKTFARVNESDLVRLSINELLQNTIKLTSAVFRWRITFQCAFDELPEVECYPGLLNQVFLNLIVNAGQAIPHEGTITIRTRNEGPFVSIDIADTGTGIPPEVRAKIFAAGFTTKPLGEGTGLGLTITRDIVVDTHHGTITFDTEMGKGTTFHVRIPIDQPRSDSTYRSSL